MAQWWNGGIHNFQRVDASRVRVTRRGAPRNLRHICPNDVLYWSILYGVPMKYSMYGVQCEQSTPRGSMLRMPCALYDQPGSSHSGDFLYCTVRNSDCPYFSLQGREYSGQLVQRYSLHYLAELCIYHIVGCRLAAHCGPTSLLHINNT